MVNLYNHHSEIPQDLSKLMDIIDNYFGNKAINSVVLIQEKSLIYILYDSFVWRFSIEERYGTFGVSLAMGNGFQGITKLFGNELSLNSDKDSVIRNLKAIDKYCRLRLPDKFLDEFEMT